MDRVAEAARLKHYSRRTEQAYAHWIRRYILFHGKRHPTEMGAEEITDFLASLAVGRNVSASTQNQALCALVFLYREVLKQDFPWLQGLVRAKRPEYLEDGYDIRTVQELLGHKDVSTTIRSTRTW